MAENLYTANCIRTFTGKYINVFDPDPDLICIEDIAHALAQQPRFGGHLPKKYTVAEHSINCMLLASRPYKFDALTHDFTEAYLLDMPSPIKLNMPEYRKIENKLQEVICKKWGLQFPLPAEVKAVDKIMLEREWNQLMLLQKAPHKMERVLRFTPKKAEKYIIEYFYKYCK